ncbi:protein FAR1-RELATED SEQUENCE 5-like [Olea europaea var. sylvestris]|uniref:protein FAR1-RELATED SEQUENCE 5-like n=1 Tax=Olea europaea var. sylvestris TaxID=158386 RepID=UPI000C1CCED6|nr:protein FAR1-RELATED SEQUENCE 5-like [Olea europaea var. sylvestris]
MSDKGDSLPHLKFIQPCIHFPRLFLSVLASKLNGSLFLTGVSTESGLKLVSYKSKYDGRNQVYHVLIRSLEMEFFMDMTEKYGIVRKEISEEVDVDNLLETDNDKIFEIVDFVDDGIVGVDGVIVTEVGIKFNGEKELFDFYKRYAYNVGFSVRKRNSQKDNDRIVRYVVFTYSREGRRNSNTSGSLKPEATIQTGCKARLTAFADACGVRKINTVNLIHNHKISPSKSRLYRCNRELSAQVKRRLEVNDMAEISLHKSYNLAVVEVGEYENMTCIEKDCQNYVKQVKRLRLGEDEESRLKNSFWADNRSRQAYKEFGDVITFDTTYLTNIYDMPFVPFVGVNHHGQSTLLSCGLVLNENTETFV